MIAVLLSIVVMIIACFIAINLLYKKTHAYKNELYPFTKYSNGISKNLKVANFGSTYALYAFDTYNELNVNGFNFSAPSQSLEVDHILLHKYADHMAQDSVVIFCLAACVTYYRYKMVTDKTHYYNYLTSKELPTFSLKDKLRSLFPLYGKRMKKAIRIILDVPEKSELYEDSPCAVSEEQAVKNMNGIAEGWISLFNLRDLKGENSNEYNKENQVFNTSLLKSMFHFCYDRSWHPIVVIPPFSSKLNQYFGDEFVDASLNKMISKAIGEYNIPVLDYRKNEVFQQASLYIDGGFRLSKYGSKKFIRMLFSDLSMLGYRMDNKTVGKS